jgi:hypothetical protein
MSKVKFANASPVSPPVVNKNQILVITNIFLWRPRMPLQPIFTTRKKSPQTKILRLTALPFLIFKASLYFA